MKRKIGSDEFWGILIFSLLSFTIIVGGLWPTQPIFEDLTMVRLKVSQVVQYDAFGTTHLKITHQSSDKIIFPANQTADFVTDDFLATKVKIEKKPELINSAYLVYAKKIKWDKPPYYHLYIPANSVSNKNLAQTIFSTSK